VAALVIATPMLVPSSRAATAMALPMIARIKAYSAAAAPSSSRIKLCKIFI
jgi:hypothetical protein